MQKLYQVVVLALATAVFCGCSCGKAHAQQLTDQDVSEAIDKIKDYLFQSQDASGAWFGSYHNGPDDGNITHQWGPSAMAALALIVSGESPQRPEIDKALRVLAEAEIYGVYPLSMRTHLWSYLPDRYKPLLERDGQTMLGSVNNGARFNYHVYGSPEFEGQYIRIDNSTTQYGILALWQVAKRGGRIPEGFWRAAAEIFVREQKADGGWSYSGEANTTQSMTCAGLAVLLVAQQELYRDRDTPEPNIAAAIEKGLDYLDRNWNLAGMETHGGGSYTFYGYERVALASGRKYFGGQDWFITIARAILQKNARYGQSVHNAAFDLMFLARGRVPVWINKLQIDGVAWNNRPNDVYFLNRYISSFRETEVNWQVVNINSDPAEWMTAPLMWLSSPSQIDFTDEQVAKIKQYLDMGGTLIVNPENRSSSMRDSIHKLAELMYPDLAFTDMAADHPMAGLVVGEERARQRPPIKVLNNGARDLIILPQQDWGLAFQRDTTPDPEDEDHWRFITNIFAVVTDRGKLTPRLSTPLVARQQRGTTGTIKVVTALIGDRTSLPETNAYSAMQNHLFNVSGYELLVEQLPLTDIVAADPTLVHLMGAHATELSVAETDALKAYIDAGGTVLIETIGGRGDFAASISRQLATVVTGQDQMLKNSSNAIRNGRDLPEGGESNRRVIYRPLTLELADPGTDMLLRGYKVDDRFPVLVSNEDLSLGMLGVSQYGINGYSIESARSIMTNILLEAEQAHPGSDTPSASAPPDSSQTTPGS